MRKRKESEKTSEPRRSTQVFDEERLDMYEGLVQAGLEGSLAYNTTQGIRQMAGHNIASALESIRESVGSVARSQERLADVLAGVQKDMAAVQRDVAVVQRDVGVVQRDVAVVQKDVSGLHADMAGVQKNIAGLQHGQVELKAEFESLAKRSKTDRRISWVVIGLLAGVVWMLVQSYLGLRPALALHPTSATSASPAASSPVAGPAASGLVTGDESSER